MDFDLLKQIVRLAAIGITVGAAWGYGGAYVLASMGFSYPAVMVILFAGGVAGIYMYAQREQKKEEERINTAIQEAYKAGAEAALKQTAHN